jgi:glucose/arabinose dehydrogenase
MFFFCPAFFSTFRLGQTRPDSALQLAPQVIQLKGRASFSMYLPDGFSISPAAEGLKRPRFLAKAPDGRMFVTTMHDLTDNSKGVVYILDSFDEKRRRYARVIPYLTNLRNPNSIAFYTDARGQDWLYLALTDRLVRYKFTRGEEVSSSKPEVLATYPAYGLSYKYGGWHLTRTIAFGQGAEKDLLYVTVGSSCNACEEREEIRATLSVMDADGKHQRIVAKGLRNAVAMRFVASTLYLTNMGADHLGSDEPDDPMFALAPEILSGAGTVDYGWPHCYYSAGKAMTDVKFPARSAEAGCENSPRTFAHFAAHSSPLGLEYFGDEFRQPLLQKHFLVALHGPSNAKLDRGYRVVRVDEHGETQDLITGFSNGGVVNGRPCDIFKQDEKSFLLSDDNAGVIYYVRAQ